MKEYIHKTKFTKRYDRDDRGDDWWKSRGYYPINRDENYKEPEWNEEIFWNPPEKWDFGSKYANVTYYYKPIKPQLKVINVESSNPDETDISDRSDDITCPVGTTLTFDIELRINDTKVDDANKTYRTPIRARDGREKIIKIDIVDGSASVKVTMRESGCWIVDSEMVNESLDEKEKMTFSGIKVYVLDKADEGE